MEKAQMKHLYYLKTVIKNGQLWQYTDISYTGNKPKCYLSTYQWIILICSITIGLFTLKKGFPDNFLGYIIAFFAILIGMYITLITTMYSRFDPDKYTKSGLNVVQAELLIREKNYLIQFTSITSYNIILSIMLIVLMCLSLLFSNFFQIEAGLCEFLSTTGFKDRSIQVILISYRSVIIYFFLDVLYLSLYAVTTMYSFINGEYLKARVNKPKL